MTAAETLAEARTWMVSCGRPELVRALIALAERPAMPEEPDADTLARFGEAIGRALNTSVGSVSAYKAYRALYAHLKERAGKSECASPREAPAMPDYSKLEGWELLRELKDDAAKWASAFNQTAVKLGYSKMDEGWLIGWFANAIEGSCDHRKQEQEKDVPEGNEGSAGERDTAMVKESDTGWINRGQFYERRLTLIYANAASKPKGWRVSWWYVGNDPHVFTDDIFDKHERDKLIASFFDNNKYQRERVAFKVEPI